MSRFLLQVLFLPVVADAAVVGPDLDECGFVLVQTHLEPSQAFVDKHPLAGDPSDSHHTNPLHLINSHSNPLIKNHSNSFNLISTGQEATENANLNATKTTVSVQAERLDATKETIEGRAESIKEHATKQAAVATSAAQQKVEQTKQTIEDALETEYESYADSATERATMVAAESLRDTVSNATAEFRKTLFVNRNRFEDPDVQPDDWYGFGKVVIVFGGPLPAGLAIGVASLCCCCCLRHSCCFRSTYNRKI